MAYVLAMSNALLLKPESAEIPAFGVLGGVPIKLDFSASLQGEEEGEEGKDSDGGAKKFNPAPIDVELYSGGVVRKYGVRMVISLDGMEIAEGQTPILDAHWHGTPIGYANDVSTKGGLRMSGVVFDPTDERLKPDVRQAVLNIQGASEQGFHWQASMGIEFGSVRYVAEDEVQSVNGSDFEGPGYVIESSTLREGSVLALGADRHTRSTMLSLDSERGTVPVQFRSKPMSEPKGDSLQDFLAAFKGREGWAAKLYASKTQDEGATFSIAEGRAELAGVLEKENAELRNDNADKAKRLSLLAKEGTEDDDAPGFSGQDHGDDEPMQFEAGEYNLAEFAQDADLQQEVNTTLRPEFAALPPKGRRAFGRKDGIGAFRALKVAEANGKVKYTGFGK